MISSTEMGSVFAISLARSWIMPYISSTTSKGRLGRRAVGGTRAPSSSTMSLYPYFSMSDLEILTEAAVVVDTHLAVEVLDDVVAELHAHLVGGSERAGDQVGERDRCSRLAHGALDVLDPADPVGDVQDVVEVRVLDVL